MAVRPNSFTVDFVLRTSILLFEIDKNTFVGLLPRSFRHQLLRLFEVTLFDQRSLMRVQNTSKRMYG